MLLRAGLEEHDDDRVRKFKCGFVRWDVHLLEFCHVVDSRRVRKGRMDWIVLFGKFYSKSNLNYSNTFTV